MTLKIFSLLKQVPVPSEMRTGADGSIDRTKAKSMINADCHFALEQALRLKEAIGRPAELYVISMGPPSFERSQRQALEMGFDHAVLLSDRALAGSDTYATGYALAKTIEKIGPGDDFVVFAGRQTSDGDTAHVPSQVAENLGIPQATFVETFEIEGERLCVRRIIEGGHQILNLPIPCLLSIAPTASVPRGPTLKGKMKAKKTKIVTYGIADIGLAPAESGVPGSPTIVAKTSKVERVRPPVQMLAGTLAEQVKGLVDRMGGVL